MNTPTALVCQRSPEALEAAVAFVDPEHTVDLQPHDVPGVGRVTMCNVAVDRALEKLGVWTPRSKRFPGHPMLANEFADWLPSDEAKQRGWHRIERAEVNAYADAGFIVLPVAKEEPHGHIAIGLPSHEQPGIHVAAAGGHCFNRCLLEATFGHLAPTFYAYP